MNLVRHKLFKKLLLSYIFTIMLPTLVISAIYFNNYSSELRDENERSVHISMQNLEQKVEMLVGKVDSLTLQLSFMSNLNSILFDPFKASIYDFSELNESFRTQISASRLVYSGYIYFKLNNKVLATNEGLYRLADFYDREIIEKASKTNDDLIEIRTMRDRLNAPPIEVISFTRNLPSVRKDVLGSMVINASKEEFFEALRKLINDEYNEIFIVDTNSRSLLFNNKNSGLTAPVTKMLTEGKWDQGRETEMLKLGGEKYFVSYLKVTNQPWVILKLLPMSFFEQKVNEKLFSIIKAVILIVIIGLAFSCLFSVIMYSPWKRILAKYGTMNRSHSQQRGIDAFDFVNNVIANLQNENQTIKSMMDQNEPLIRHRLIYDLLNNNLSNNSIHFDRLAQMGIDLPLPYYMVLLISSGLQDEAEAPDSGKMKLYAFSLAENVLKEHFNLCGTLLDDDRFGFVINLERETIDDPLRKTLQGCCKNINEQVQWVHNMTLTFSCGHTCGSLDEIHNSYLQAKKLTRYKALNHAEIVFMQDIRDHDERLEYPLHIEKALLHSIKSVDREKTKDILGDLFQLYISNTKYSREQIHGMVIILVSTLIHDLMQEGFEADFLNSEGVLKVNECNSMAELEHFMQSYLQTMINDLESQSDKKSTNLYISQAIQFVEMHFRENFALTDISEYVGLSSSYLSRIFKQQTGRSLIDYLAKYRVEKSIELLKDGTRYSLKEIGSMVGFTEVHSFIRCFKKYEGVTPGEYRKHL
ncbi:helix-turn-helix domain-containing protein [Paenibacillus thalictri]|uniref:AraC family transcriptional regulator n=1 Tax=Paenibacillus thalictri TaxID=2527873 RepID=A0A4Q9E0H2_9BACL|nr:helix-turn-helix domain-containing protein [Paenibacillus thalictri]TBL81940.1 AraC family transcriptional regulator [Paenibacillus thalictri]